MGTEDCAVRDALIARYPHAEDGLVEFVSILGSDGLTRGLIGPREVDRLWSRHVANSAVVEELVSANSTMADVGSGAGLPGIPNALVRPDLTVILVEPLLRRATFLTEAVERLGLADRVSILRGRAEDVSLQVDVVTARAVAPLDRLVGWTLPLATVGGTVLALKGESAEAELALASAELERLGGGGAQVLMVGAQVVDPPTTVVRIMKLKAPRRSGRR